MSDKNSSLSCDNRNRNWLSQSRITIHKNRKVLGNFTKTKPFRCASCFGGFAFEPSASALVTVLSLRGGAYPVAELRMSSYKNTFLNYLPEHLIVRDCENVFNSPNHNEYLHKRGEYGLGLLVEFSKVFAQVRDSGRVDLKHYPYGF